MNSMLAKQSAKKLYKKKTSRLAIFGFSYEKVSEIRNKDKSTFRKVLWDFSKTKQLLHNREYMVGKLFFQYHELFI
jgi:hypothetical protein